LKPGEKTGDTSFGKMRYVATLYRLFCDLAMDIRSKDCDMERIVSFRDRAENFFQLFKRHSAGCSTGRKPYLHILRDHVSDFMLFWSVVGWGYGYFNCNAGEHLNKCVKNLELHSTNLDKDRFQTIMRTMRAKQIYYPESICLPEKVVTCSACKQKGHNKKNKNCLMHPDQPEPYFSDSEDE